MIGWLFRLVFLLLCAALLVSTWWQHLSTTVSFAGHDTFYTQVHPWLRQIREWSMFGVLAFCILIARRDPTFTRIGLLAVIAALALELIPPREVHQAVTKIESMRIEPNR
jgi:predicted MFS family arabinose efflux permease